MQALSLGQGGCHSPFEHARLDGLAYSVFSMHQIRRATAAWRVGWLYARSHLLCADKDVACGVQVGVFSATLPPDALDITRKFMNKPVRPLSGQKCPAVLSVSTVRRAQHSQKSCQHC